MFSSACKRRPGAGAPGVATPANPGPVTVHLFLCYADEDEDIAGEVVNRIAGKHSSVSIYSSHNGTCTDGHADDGRRGVESLIRESDAFLALLSPGFMASAECLRERDVALDWERNCRQVKGVGSVFVRVLQVRETPGARTGVLRDRPWLNLTSPEAIETAVAELARSVRHDESAGDDVPIGPVGNGGAGQVVSPHSSGGDAAQSVGLGLDAGVPRHGGSGAAGGAVGGPVFRNRKTELDQVVEDGLGNADGEHFWLVIAPPQMGKSWLLRKIENDVRSQGQGRWVVRSVDLREWPEGVVPDADEIVGAMFSERTGGPSGPVSRYDLPGLADGLIKTGRFHLRLIDSAELLANETVATLRSYLAQIHANIKAAGNPRVRLALIVASRREPEWRGITPPPRLRTLPLSEFKEDVVRDALEEIANRAGRPMGPAELRDNAALIHRVSEGLPALLVKYLDWIESAHWGDLNRLADQAIFDELARPYIDQVVLSSSSLLGHTGDLPGVRRAVIEAALHALVPYRLLTQSHLSHHATEGALHAAMDAAGWPVERVWEAVSNTALLYRPQENPWHRIDAPIRRLLFRYWYPGEELRRQAHQRAGSFVRSLASGPLGRDQAYLLVECLWHEANALAGSGQDEMRDGLVGLAGLLSGKLAKSSAFSKQSLRECAVERLSEDPELAAVLSTVDGWLASVRQAILSPD